MAEPLALKQNFNQDVGTPDRGDGIVMGWAAGYQVIIRLRRRAEFTPAQRITTCSGWQWIYAQDELIAPNGKWKVKA